MKASRKILVVEDNAPLRGQIVQVLEMEGYAVVSAGDGQSALDLALAHPPATARRGAQSGRRPG